LIGSRGDDLIGSHSLCAFGYYAFSGLQSFFDDPHLTDSVADPDRSDADFVVGVDDRNAIAALHFGHRALGN
jgi:hypothetical protein